MKLILHIGTAKTGTTSLQGWFSTNRDGLGAQGIWYPRTPGGENHRKLMVYARDTDKPDPSFAKFGIRTPSEHEAFRTRLRHELTLEVEVSQRLRHHSWVISSEHLHSKVTTVPMIQRLHDLLAPLFDQITVYLHLRPQIDLLVSNASQRARMGRPVTRADLTRDAVSTSSSYFNYNKIVGHWEQIFGAENLVLKPFRRMPDMLGFMSQMLELDLSRLTPLERANRGLDWRSLALANTVNAGFAALKLAPPSDFHLDDMPGTERLQLGRDLAQEMQGRFDASNAKLAKRRPDVTEAELTPDWSAYAQASNLHLIEAPCLFAEQLTHMVRRFAQDRALEQWRRHIAEGRLAALTGDGAALKRAKRLASEAAAELDALGMVVDDPGDAAPQSVAS